MRNTLIFLLLLGACVSTPQRLYTGPQRPRTETARLSTDSGIDALIEILWVDETRTQQRHDLEVLPGDHTVTIKVTDWYGGSLGDYLVGDQHKRYTVAIRMHAEAGQRYVFYFRKNEIMISSGPRYKPRQPPGRPSRQSQQGEPDPR